MVPVAIFPIKWSATFATGDGWFTPTGVVRTPLWCLVPTTHTARAIGMQTIMVLCVFCIVTLATITTKLATVHHSCNTVHAIVMGFGFSITVLIIGFYNLNHFRRKLILFSSKYDTTTYWVNDNQLVTHRTQIVLKFLNFFVPTWSFWNTCRCV